MKVEYMPVDKLIPYVNNPKKHPPDQVKKIASSIKEFGFKVPIVVSRDYEIIAGHGRYEAAKLLGLEQVPVIIADDLTPAQVRAFRIADNKVAESDWDEFALRAELEMLLEDGYDLGLTGFDEEEYLKLLEDSSSPEVSYDVGELAPPAEGEYKLTLSFQDPDVFDDVIEFFRQVMAEAMVGTREEAMIYIMKKWRGEM